MIATMLIQCQWKQVDTEKHTEEVMEDVSFVSAVAEPSEYQYGAEAFVAVCAKGEQAKVPEVKAPNVPKQGKSRWSYDG